MGNDNDKPTDDIAHMSGISENLQDDYGAVNNSPVLKGFKIYDTICLGNLIVALVYNLFMGVIFISGMAIAEIAAPVLVIIAIVAIIKAIGQSIQERKGDKQ